MSHLSRSAHKCGIERHARATSDGVGITVDLDGHLVSARSVNEAIRVPIV